MSALGSWTSTISDPDLEVDEETDVKYDPAHMQRSRTLLVLNKEIQEEMASLSILLDRVAADARLNAEVEWEARRFIQGRIEEDCSNPQWQQLLSQWNEDNGDKQGHRNSLDTSSVAESMELLRLDDADVRRIQVPLPMPLYGFQLNLSLLLAIL